MQNVQEASYRGDKFYLTQTFIALCKAEAINFKPLAACFDKKDFQGKDQGLNSTDLTIQYCFTGLHYLNLIMAMCKTETKRKRILRIITKPLIFLDIIIEENRLGECDTHRPIQKETVNNLIKKFVNE